MKDDVVAIEIEGKLRNLITESSANLDQKASTGPSDEASVIIAPRPKYFTIGNVVELAYQSRKAHLYLDQTGVEDREFEVLRQKSGKPESLSERTDLDDLLKEYLRDAVEKKKVALEKLRNLIVKPPESFSKILSNRFEVTVLNLFLVPVYLCRYRYQDKIREMRINGVTGEVLE